MPTISIYSYTNTNQDNDTNPPSNATSVEPSLNDVVDPRTTASIPPTDEVLRSPIAMGYSLEQYSCNVALSNDQSPMAVETKYQGSTKG